MRIQRTGELRMIRRQALTMLEVEHSKEATNSYMDAASGLSIIKRLTPHRAKSSKPAHFHVRGLPRTAEMSLHTLQGSARALQEVIVLHTGAVLYKKLHTHTHTNACEDNKTAKESQRNTLAYHSLLWNVTEQFHSPVLLVLIRNWHDATLYRRGR